MSETLMTANFASAVSACTGIVEPFKLLHLATTHSQVFGVWAAIDASQDIPVFVLLPLLIFGTLHWSKQVLKLHMESVIVDEYAYYCLL